MVQPKLNNYQALKSIEQLMMILWPFGILARFYALSGPVEVFYDSSFKKGNTTFFAAVQSQRQGNLVRSKIEQ